LSSAATASTRWRVRERYCPITYLGPGTSLRILLIRNRNGQLKLKGEPSPLYLYPSFPSTSQLSFSPLPLHS